MPATAVVLRAVAAELAAAGVETPAVDAELLLGHVLGLSRAELRLAADRDVEEGERRALAELVARRAAREPLQYVLGEWAFRRLVLRVDRRALIPRPETEVLVERALALLAAVEAPVVLDAGVGSGAIALAIADEHPGARVVGVDVSGEALALAAENADRTGLAIELRRHDLRAGIPAGPWDAVVSNPPYVADAERPALPPEVREWEPPLALYGDLVETLARASLPELAPGGALVLEVAAERAAAAAGLLRGRGYDEVRVTRDLAGRDRVVEGRRAR